MPVSSGCFYSRMSGVADADGGEVTGEIAFKRGQHVYDRWSSHGRLYDAVMRLTEPLRNDAFTALSVEPGETVLDLGCGPGQNVDRLQEAVGPAGQVVGLDDSPGMVERARARVSDNGWSNVDIVETDDAGSGYLSVTSNGGGA